MTEENEPSSICDGAEIIKRETMECRNFISTVMSHPATDPFYSHCLAQLVYPKLRQFNDEIESKDFARPPMFAQRHMREMVKYKLEGLAQSVSMWGTAFDDSKHLKQARDIVNQANMMMRVLETEPHN